MREVDIEAVRAKADARDDVPAMLEEIEFWRRRWARLLAALKECSCGTCNEIRDNLEAEYRKEAEALGFWGGQ